MLAFGVMSEKMLAIFAALSLAFVAVVLVGFLARPWAPRLGVLIGTDCPS